MELRKLLDKAIEYDNKYRPNPLENGNLFSVLGMENKEVSAHSAFLYFVFKPFMQHNGTLDDRNLRALMRVLDKGADKEYGYLNIEREVYSEFGRMDFVIHADDDIFVIELKIWAEEQWEQLVRYRDYLISQGANENNIFYLTPDKRAPKTNENATNITLKIDIKPVLKLIANERKANGFDGYASMIEQYIDIIDKITGENNMKERPNILESKADMLAVESLVTERRERLTQLMTNFFTLLKEKLGTMLTSNGGPSAKQISYAYGEDSTKNYYLQKCYPALLYEIADFPIRNGCELANGVGLYFFIEIGENLYCGISPRKIDDDKSYTVKNINAFPNNRPNVDKMKHTAVFTVWDHIKDASHKINFAVGSLNQPTSFVNLLEGDDLKFSDGKIESIANQIKALYNEFCNVLFDVKPNGN